VTGSWLNWDRRVLLVRSKSGGAASVRVAIPALPPSHLVYFKYIVDGRWCYDMSRPWAVDAAGNVNNVLRLPATHCPLLTANLRVDTPSDGAASWRFRRDAAAELVLSRRRPLAVCTQEGLQNQLDDLCRRCPAYGRVGVGRDNGDSGGEFCAVFWDKEQTALEASGTFWLSETPDRPSVIAVNTLPRIATWALLRCKLVPSEPRILVCSTHLDHMSRAVRCSQAVVLLSQLHSIW